MLKGSSKAARWSRLQTLLMFCEATPTVVSAHCFPWQLAKNLSLCLPATPSLMQVKCRTNGALAEPHHESAVRRREQKKRWFRNGRKWRTAREGRWRGGKT
jgi:hypothetical protein